MNYKEAEKIQLVVATLDNLNNESTFVAAIVKHSYNEAYSVYIYGRNRKYHGTMRAARIAMTISDNSDNIIMRVAEYNAGTSIVDMVTAWELF